MEINGNPNQNGLKIGLIVMVSETMWIYIKVTVSLAIWTVSRVFEQLKNNYYGHGLRFYMSSYYGDNIPGNLGLPKSVLTSFFYIVLESIRLIILVTISSNLEIVIIGVILECI